VAVHKGLRSQGGCPVRKFCGQRWSSDVDIRTVQCK